MIENKKSFGEYLRLKRTEAGLTQKMFADKLFVTESAVSKWERGLSYPDITLITEICTLLGLSEHELLTASEDITLRSKEKLADRYLRLLKKLKIIQYIIYGLPIFICFIVNIAVGGTLDWFFIVVTSILTSASLTLLPILIINKGRMRSLIVIGGFTASLTLLLMTCAIYTSGDWFAVTLVSVIFGLSVLFLPDILNRLPLPSPFCNHKALITLAVNSLLLFLMLLTIDIYVKGGWFFTVALPITGISLLLPYSSLLINRYTKINIFFKIASNIAITGVFLTFIEQIVDLFIDNPVRKFWFLFNFNNWNAFIESNILAIIMFSLIGLTVIFTAIGVVFEINNYRNPKKSKITR